MLRQPNPRLSASSTKGFSLVIAITLMSMLLLSVLALSTLITTEILSSQQRESLNQARQNALLGLHVALGQLQTTIGPDQKITAPANIIGAPEELRNWIGAWDTTDPNASPIWLVSGNKDPMTWYPPWNSTGASTDPSSALMVSSGSVSLQDENNNSLPDDLVAVPKVPIEKNNNEIGSYAYWVSDENQKARINLEPQKQGWSNTTTNAEGRINLTTLNHTGLSDLTNFSNINLSDPVTIEHLTRTEHYSDLELSLDGNFDSTQNPNRNFHDLTTVSIGLPTNVVDGGLKKDLSLAFEMEDSAFRNSEFADEYTNPTGDKVSFLYKEHDSSTGGDVRGPTWDLLRNYYRLHKEVPNSTSSPVIQTRGLSPNRPDLGNTSDYISLMPSDLTGNIKTKANYINTTIGGEDVPFPTAMQISPVLQRLIFIMTIAQDDSGNLNTIVKPLVVLWNPYNITLSFDCIALAYRRIPLSLKTDITLANGEQIASTTGFMSAAYRSSRHPGPNASSTPMRLYIMSGNGNTMTNPTTLQPGEAKIFSIPGNEPTLLQYNSRAFMIPRVTLSEGWNPHGGIRADLIGDTIINSAGNNFTNWIQVPVSSITSGTTQLILADSPSKNADFSVGIYHLHEGNDLTNGYNNLDNGPTSKLHEYLFNMQPYLNVRDFNNADDPFEEINLNPNRFPVSQPGTGWTEVPIGMLDIYTRTIDTANHPTNLGATHNIRASLTNRKLGNQQIVPGDEVFIDSRMSTPGSMDLEDTQIPTGKNVYWGTSLNAINGQTHTPFFDIPTTPPISLGDLRHADIHQSYFTPGMAIGNSRASPMISRDKRLERLSSSRYAMTDVSYLANEALFDDYFFSGMVPEINYTSNAYSEDRSLTEVMTDYFDAGTTLSLNPRIAPTYEPESAGTLRDEFLDGTKLTDEAYKKSATLVSILGPFNVNSTNVNAWTALLSSLRDDAIAQINQNGDISTLESHPDLSHPLWSRLSLPLDATSPQAEPWKGWTALDDDKIRKLAEAIVVEVKLRGPFKSYAEFVNRKLIAKDSDTNDIGLQGALQAAIQKAGINDDLLSVTGSQPEHPRNYLAPEHSFDESAAGIPGFLMQADLLGPLAPVLTVRSDTFIIRAYGDTVNPITGKVEGKAWCEAVIQRMPDFVNTGTATDPAWTDQESLNTINQTFGRRLEIKSFRWLEPDEV